MTIRKELFKVLTCYFFLLLIPNISRPQNTTNFIDKSEKSISRIENNIIPQNRSGEDKGKPQTLLSRMEALKIPGVSITVFDNGEIIWARGYGFGDKNAASKVDTTTIFQAASISKPLATVAMFALAEKNIINPDEDVNRQLDSWKIPDNEYTIEEKVTPKRIVSHTAGLSIPGFQGYKQNANIPGLLQILDGKPPANSKPVRVINQPGLRENYSGGGFTVLQLLLQEKTGKPFAELMDELVLNALSMNNSSFVLKPSDSMKKSLAKGYLSNGKMVDSGYYIYPEQAAAGLWTTPSDYARFMINLGNSYIYGNGLLLQSTVRMMFTKVQNGNGLGFGVEGENNSLRFSHTGSNQGYYCHAVSFANFRRGVVVMTNSNNGAQIIKEIVRAIYREYNWSK